MSAPVKDATRIPPAPAGRWQDSPIGIERQPGAGAQWALITRVPRTTARRPMAEPVTAIDKDRSRRWRRARLLRTQGLTLREVGERLGVSKERARQLIWQARAEAQRDAL